MVKTSYHEFTNEKQESGVWLPVFLSSSLVGRMEGKITGLCWELCHISILVIICCSLGF